MLTVGLRAPISSLLQDSWLYKRFDVLPYEFGMGSALITTMTILITILIVLRWMDNRGKVN